MRILSIEDDEPTRFIIKQRLKSGGIPTDQFEYSESMHSASNKAMIFNPDIVLFDLVLPDSNLQNSLTVLPNFTKLYPVIILSGNGDTKLWEMTIRELGAMDYLHKVAFLAKGNEAFLAHSVLNAIWKFSACQV